MLLDLQCLYLHKLVSKYLFGNSPLLFIIFLLFVFLFVDVVLFFLFAIDYVLPLRGIFATSSIASFIASCNIGSNLKPFETILSNLSIVSLILFLFNFLKAFFSTLTVCFFIFVFFLLVLLVLLLFFFYFLFATFFLLHYFFFNFFSTGY